jgi:tRNA(Arg) A34 adenosine deaminase TadA
MNESDKKFMQRAIELAESGMNANAGGPFGCVIAKDGEIIGEGCNSVTSTNDPTAHAEIVAIREACQKVGAFQLDGCVVYTSCEPCPMCLGAIYWARPERVYFACTREDAANIGFDDRFIYEELEKANDERHLQIINLMRDEALDVFRKWQRKPDKQEY